MINDIITNLQLKYLKRYIFTSEVLDTTSTSITLAIKNNYKYIYGTLTSLSLSYTDKIDGTILLFSSGTTKTTFAAPASICFYGDNCTNKIFTPVESKRYMIGFFMDNTTLCGIVNTIS